MEFENKVANVRRPKLELCNIVLSDFIKEVLDYISSKNANWEDSYKELLNSGVITTTVQTKLDIFLDSLIMDSTAKFQRNDSIDILLGDIFVILIKDRASILAGITCDEIANTIHERMTVLWGTKKKIYNNDEVSEYICDLHDSLADYKTFPMKKFLAVCKSTTIKPHELCFSVLASIALREYQSRNQKDLSRSVTLVKHRYLMDLGTEIFDCSNTLPNIEDMISSLENLTKFSTTQT